MGCDLTGGRLLLCTDRLGGAKRLFLANFDPDRVHELPVTAKELTEMFAMDISRYDLEEGAGGMAETTAKPGNGSRSYDISGEFSIAGVTKEMQEELDLVTAAKLWVFVEDKNGNVILYGRESGCEALGTVETGAAKGDLNGYKIAITGAERYSSPLCKPFTNYPFDTYTTLPPVITPAFPVVA